MNVVDLAKFIQIMNVVDGRTNGPFMAEINDSLRPRTTARKVEKFMFNARAAGGATKGQKLLSAVADERREEIGDK